MRRVFAVATLALLLPLFASAQSTFCPTLTKNLSYGSRGSDVVKLQQFLIAQKLLPFSSATGFYGKGTQSAVQQWQKKNGVVSSGTPATTSYGAVGPKTRAAIASCRSARNTVPSNAQSSYKGGGSPYAQGSYTPSVPTYSQANYHAQGSYPSGTTTATSTNSNCVIGSSSLGGCTLK